MPTPPEPRVPRWVKTFALITLTLALLLAGLQVASGGRHGPGRHLLPAEPASPQAHP